MLKSPKENGRREKDRRPQLKKGKGHQEEERGREHRKRRRIVQWLRH